MSAARRAALKDLPDRELVLAFQSGEEGAYDEIFARYGPRVRRTCASKLGSSPDADEAVQETFLRAYQALPRFNGQYQLAAWLNRIATNVCIDEIRSRCRAAATVQLGEQHEGLQTEDGPELRVVGNTPRVDEAIREIKPLHAQALRLRAVEGLSHDEMAGKLAMSPSQVKALLHRARTSFRRAWDEASNLALAPLLALRRRGADRGAAYQGELMALAQSTTLAADRVLASAVLVAVALATPGAMVVREDTAKPRPAAIAAGFFHDAQPAPPRGPRLDLSGSSSASAASEASAPVLDPSVDPHALLRETLGAVGSNLDDYSPSDSDDDGEKKGQDDPSPHEVVEKLEAVLEEIPEPGPLP